MTNLHGPYRIVDRAFLTEKANRGNDPPSLLSRDLSNNRYETYLAEVGSVLVQVHSYRSGPITGRMEILYARSGWIEDA